MSVFGLSFASLKLKFNLLQHDFTILETHLVIRLALNSKLTFGPKLEFKEKSNTEYSYHISYITLLFDDFSIFTLLLEIILY